MAWALAVLKHQEVTWMHQMATAAVRQMPQFGPQSLWNLAWAVAVLDCNVSAALPEALATTARAKKRQLTARGFCNMVWAFATWAKRDVPFCEAMASVALEKLPQFQEQDMANST